MKKKEGVNPWKRHPYREGADQRKPYHHPLQDEADPIKLLHHFPVKFPSPVHQTIQTSTLITKIPHLQTPILP